MSTEAQKRASAKYQREKVKRIPVKFYPGDEELYEHVQSKKGGEGSTRIIGV